MSNNQDSVDAMAQALGYPLPAKQKVMGVFLKSLAEDVFPSSDVLERMVAGETALRVYVDEAGEIKAEEVKPHE